MSWMECVIFRYKFTEVEQDEELRGDEKVVELLQRVSFIEGGDSTSTTRIKYTSRSFKHATRNHQFVN